MKACTALPLHLQQFVLSAIICSVVFFFFAFHDRCSSSISIPHKQELGCSDSILSTRLLAPSIFRDVVSPCHTHYSLNLLHPVSITLWTWTSLSTFCSLRLSLIQLFQHTPTWQRIKARSWIKAQTVEVRHLAVGKMYWPNTGVESEGKDGQYLERLGPLWSCLIKTISKQFVNNLSFRVIQKCLPLFPKLFLLMFLHLTDIMYPHVPHFRFSLITFSGVPRNNTGDWGIIGEWKVGLNKKDWGFWILLIIESKSIIIES